MDQTPSSSSTPFTPRPRPPRVRSHLSSSINRQQTTASATAGTARPALSRQPHSNHQDGPLGTLASLVKPPETPPYTPPLPCIDVIAGGLNDGEDQRGKHPIAAAADEQIQTAKPHDVPEDSMRTAEQLEALLLEAHRTIQARERDLGIAASIGKSLLDDNVALRARQDALRARVTQPPARSTVGSSPAVLQNEFEQVYGASGALYESRPPPSPRKRDGADRKASLTSPRKGSSGSPLKNPYYERGSIDPFAHGSRSRNVSVSSVSSDRIHSRSSSSSTLFGTTRLESGSGGSSATPQLPSIFTSVQVQQQHAQLASENAQLSAQLSVLETELQQADVSGKKKLRKLGKELVTIRTELEHALLRNQELEERLSSSRSAKHSGASIGDLSRSSSSEGPVECDIDSSRTEDTQATAPDPEFDAVPDREVFSGSQVENPQLDHHGSGEWPEQHEALISASLPRSRSGRIGENRDEAVLVALLMSKIKELEETNAAIASDRAELDDKLDKARQECDEMKRKYDFLEDRVIEAEMRNHRVIGWEPEKSRQRAIEWRPNREPAKKMSDALESTQRRRALGNRAAIERHRRLSSLFGGTPPPPQLYRSASTSAVNSARNTPKSQSAPPDGSPCHRQPEHTIHAGSERTARTTLEEDDSLGRETLSESEAIDVFGSGLPDAYLFHSLHASLSELQQSQASSATISNDSDADDDEEEEGIRDDDHSGTDQLSWTASTWDSLPRSDSRAVALHRRDFNGIGAAVGRTQASSATVVKAGPPDAESYEELERALADIPVSWEDDDPAALHRALLRDIEEAAAPKKSPRTRYGNLSWAYEDHDDELEEHDPWLQEEQLAGARRAGHLAVESKEMVEFRQRADERAERRRRRLQELAEELQAAEEADLLESHNVSQGDLSARTISALRRLDSDRSLASDASGSDESTAFAYEQVAVTRRQGARGTDYWPISTRARYHPAMVAKRIAVTSQAYVHMCILWSRFLAVLAVAVVFSLWRGPRDTLGGGRRRIKRREESTALVRRGSDKARRDAEGTRKIL